MNLGSIILLLTYFRIVHLQDPGSPTNRQSDSNAKKKRKCFAKKLGISTNN